MALYSVKGEFVARATATKGGFGPSTDFDAAVGADDGIALLCQGGVGGAGAADHGLWGKYCGGLSLVDWANVFDV